MSRSRLHVFVEGRELDSYVYGKMLSVECPKPFEYSLKRADELPGSGGGGKSELKRLHDWLRRKSALMSDFKGHRFACVVMLDKDVDDLLGRRKRSKHVIYTPTYDLEGHVYLNGALRDAVAAACFLDPGRVSSHAYGDADRWATKAMLSWKEWVRLCVAAQMLGTQGICNFGVKSQINAGLVGPVDMAAAKAHETQLVSRCPHAGAKARGIVESAGRRVDARYASGRASEIFKGKWFGDILSHEVEQLFPAEHKRAAGFKQRVLSLLAQSLEPGGTWAEPFAVPVRAMVAAL